VRDATCNVRRRTGHAGGLADSQYDQAGFDVLCDLENGPRRRSSLCKTTRLTPEFGVFGYQAAKHSFGRSNHFLRALLADSEKSVAKAIVLTRTEGLATAFISRLPHRSL